MKTYLITFFANSRLLQTTYITAVDRLAALKEFRILYRDVEIFDLRIENS
jgi:hypothetical protein